MENKEKRYYSMGTPAPTEKVKDVTVNGNSVVIGKVAEIPKATTSVFGVVKPDGTTVTINDGVISAVGGGEPEWDDVKNKPFDEEEEELITILDETVNYDSESQAFLKDIENEELLKDEYIGKKIKVTIDETEYETEEVEKMGTFLFAFYNYENLEIVDYPAIAIVTNEIEGVYGSQIVYADNETHTSEDSVNFKAEIERTTITKLDGSKIKVDGDTVKVNEDGELEAIVPETKTFTFSIDNDDIVTCDKTYEEILTIMDTNNYKCFIKENEIHESKLYEAATIVDFHGQDFIEIYGFLGNMFTVIYCGTDEIVLEVRRLIETPIATTQIAGKVKPDGITIIVDNTGTLRVNTQVLFEEFANFMKGE